MGTLLGPTLHLQGHTLLTKGTHLVMATLHKAAILRLVIPLLAILLLLVVTLLLVTIHMVILVHLLHMDLMRMGTAVWGHCLLVVLLLRRLPMGLTMFPMATMDMVDMDTCLTGNSSIMASSSMGSLSMGSLARVCSRSGSDDIFLYIQTAIVDAAADWFYNKLLLFDVHLYYTLVELF